MLSMDAVHKFSLKNKELGNNQGMGKLGINVVYVLM